MGSLYLLLAACGYYTYPYHPDHDIPLYPSFAPGSTQRLPDGQQFLSPSGELMRVEDVSTPTLTVYVPGGVANGQTGGFDNSLIVLVIPGGRYEGVSYGHEGIRAAEVLNMNGVTAAVLKYRVGAYDPPPQPSMGRISSHWAPMMDAQRAMGIVRANASSWGVTNLQHVGVMGFSSGAHLAATLSTPSSLCVSGAQPAGGIPRMYAAQFDDADMQTCRPDFQILVYPVTAGAEFNVSADSTTPGPNTPPSFVTYTDADSHVDAQNQFVQQLAAVRADNNQPTSQDEVHTFPPIYCPEDPVTGRCAGGMCPHGYGTCLDNIFSKEYVAQPACFWTGLVADWMRLSGYLHTQDSPADYDFGEAAPLYNYHYGEAREHRHAKSTRLLARLLRARASRRAGRRDMEDAHVLAAADAIAS